MIFLNTRYLQVAEIIVSALVLFNLQILLLIIGDATMAVQFRLAWSP